MKIPKRIDVAGHDVTIRRKKLDKCFGRFNKATGLMLLDTEWDGEKYTDSVIETALLHEITEAVNFYYDIGLTHRQIKLIEIGFFQVLRDNDLNFRKRG